MEQPSTIADVQETVRRRSTIGVTGGGSKPAMSAGANVSLSRLAGVLEYEPAEFAFTALAGTPIAAIQERLAEHGQYLPFDPPLVAAGATLGGTVAAGFSGPGRFRYGGGRDFLLGVRLVNGEGELIRGGGKGVKNAAGFDLPKLMVGSQGRLGVIVELSCKVFPRPAAWATLAVDLPDLNTALTSMLRLAGSPLELTCLDLEPPGRLWVRLGGLPESLPRRIERVRGAVEGRWSEIPGEEEERIWQDVREFAWVPVGCGLVKVPLVPRQIPAMERELSDLAVPVVRRYSVGGNVAWLAWHPELPASQLQGVLEKLGLSAVAVTGTWPAPLVGVDPGRPFAQRLLQVFDPRQKFQSPSLSTV